MLNDLISVEASNGKLTEPMIDDVGISTILYIFDLVKLKIKQLNSYLADINTYQTELDALMANGGKDEARIGQLNKLLEQLNIDYTNYGEYLKTDRVAEDIFALVPPSKSQQLDYAEKCVSIIRNAFRNAYNINTSRIDGKSPFSDVAIKSI